MNQYGISDSIEPVGPTPERASASEGDALVAALRAGLRSPEGDTERRRHRLERALEPLLERSFARLLAFCERITLAQSVPPGRARIEAGDLAQDAWTRTLRYLQSPKGNRIKSDGHFERFLICVARNRLYDLTEGASMAAERAGGVAMDAPTVGGDAAPGVTEGDRLASTAPETLPTTLRWARTGGRAGEVVTLLFTDEAAFREILRERGIRRHPRLFRAFALYELARFYGSEIDGAPPDAVRIVGSLLRGFVGSCRVPASVWREIEAAVERGADGAALCAAVNRLCDNAGLTEGNVLSVLRYDLNRCLSGPVNTVSRKGGKRRSSR